MPSETPREHRAMEAHRGDSGEPLGIDLRAEQKKAKGGEIKPMDLSRVHLTHETDTHYHLKDHRGPFAVAKKGLSKAMHSKIQAFAEGGESQPDAPPAQPDPAAVEQLADATAPAPPTIPGSGASSAPSAPPADLSIYDNDQLRRMAAMNADPAVQQALVSEAQGRLGTNATPEQRAQVVRDFTSIAGSDVPRTPPADGTTTDTGASTQATGASPTAAADASPAASPAGAAAAPSMPGIPGMPGTPKAPDTEATQKQVGEAYEAARAAEQAKANTARDEAAKTLEVQQTLEQHRQDLQKSWETTLSGWQKRGDDLRQSILDQKIDPDRYWKDANGDTNVGRKVKAAFGLILGGLGGGLTHGPNQALQVIQSAIERDVDAQKAELGKKTTLLGFHVQEGHDLMAARQMAMADMKDAAAAQLAMVSTKFAGDKAQAGAQANIAALQRSAAMDRQAVAYQGFDAQFKRAQLGIAQAAAGREAALFPYQLGQAQAGLALARMKWGMLSGAVGPGGTQDANASGTPVIDQRTGRPVTATVATNRLLIDPGDRQKAQDAIMSTHEQIQKIQAIRDFAEAHPHGVAWSRADIKRAKALVADAELSWNRSQEGNNRLSDTDLGVINGIFADPSSIWQSGTGQVKAALDVAMGAANRKMAAVKDMYLMPNTGSVDPRIGILDPEMGKRVIRVPEQMVVRRRAAVPGQH